MMTFVNRKSGVRYPEFGVESWFQNEEDRKKKQYHIKPGNIDCTNGWKKLNLKNWVMEEIPDLAKPFTDDQWREYATKYGTECAQEFLEWCDYSKPSVAYRMFHPPENREIWENPENELWFRATFRTDLSRFMDGYALGLANAYTLDMIKFEKHLAYEFKYPINEDESMKDYFV